MAEEMEISPTLYNELNKAWKATCRIVLGDEVGELKEYEEWLKQYTPKLRRRKSHLSGKDVVFSVGEHCDSARFISSDEAREIGVPLSINEIKDIDSVVRAVSEKWEYAGNSVIGNSSYVEMCDYVVDSHYAAHSFEILKSDHLFASIQVYPGSKYLFGSGATTASEFLIRHIRGSYVKRCFETHLVSNSSDVYLSAHCNGCMDVMFSFNQESKRNCIGNLELPKERYLELKKKLLGEIRERLAEDKRFPSIFELVPNEAPGSDVRIAPRVRKAEEDVSPMEKAFSSTFRVIFKRDPGGIGQYKNWLSRHTALAREIASPFGSVTYVSDEKDMPAYAFLPDKRIVSEIEAAELGKLRLDETDITGLDRILEAIPRIHFITTEYHSGNNFNVIKTPVVLNASNV